jgi:DNA polymerase-3 subunit gamma/tau
MSLYNKYRPKTFNDLIQSKFNKDFVFDHHAYLFFGSSGVGKTSAARLCMTNFVPESEVDLVIAGKHPDYIEINCAVQNGVDDMRNIVSDIVSTVPISSKYKIIVFDEAHMLTTQAQNALLKSVEEPPKYIIYIFCTTEINKVLPTIRTRCQVVPFIKLKEESLIKILQNVCKGEGFDFNKESLGLIASCSDGSARNAINLLEQCSASLEEPNTVATILGTASASTFKQLTDCICAKDRIGAIKLIDETLGNAIDPNTVFNKYADYLADLIVLKLTNKDACKYEGKHLLVIANGVTNILKDFKLLQNIKLISKIYVLKMIEAI